MRQSLLRLLRCPGCRCGLELVILDASGEAVLAGLLHCDAGHWYPIVRAIPRMLPDALHEHWHTLEPLVRSSIGKETALESGLKAALEKEAEVYDHRTRQNFSLEWQYYEVGDLTWGISVENRVRIFFLEPLRVAPGELKRRVVLDAGCGNGSQSIAYAEFGLEVVAMDLSSGLEHGQALLDKRADRPDQGVVHFVQGDLMAPPLADSCFDIIHAAGVLHHTPDTEQAFRRLCKLLSPEGLFYIWVYKYEPVATPVVNSIRAITTRMPPHRFAQLAWRGAFAFQAFTRVLDRLRIRSYGHMSRREAALALLDIFGAPYAHYHSEEEVKDWFYTEGFVEVWGCNDSRRGFDLCGRRAPVG